MEVGRAWWSPDVILPIYPWRWSLRARQQLKHRPSSSYHIIKCGGLRRAARGIHLWLPLSYSPTAMKFPPSSSSSSGGVSIVLERGAHSPSARGLELHALMIAKRKVGPTLTRSQGLNFSQRSSCSSSAHPRRAISFDVYTLPLLYKHSNGRPLTIIPAEIESDIYRKKRGTRTSNKQLLLM